MFAAVCVAALLACAAASGEWTNTKVKRSIDLTSQVVKEVTVVTAKGTGEADSRAVYKLSFADADVANTAFLQVKSGDATLNTVKLPSFNGYTLYSVQLSKPVGKNETVTLEVTSVRTHALIPKPAEITQKEPQLLLLTGNTYFTSPYPTKKQETVVTFPSSAISSYTKTEPFKLSGSTLTYGPYKDIDAYTQAPFSLHFTSFAPFVTFTEVGKEIEVSHWGNIAVEEQYDLQHTGAVLKGGFSRIDYQMAFNAPSPSFRGLTAYLPWSAQDVYYRDIIGNISTSHLRYGEDSVEFEIETRFPMFGGWKTQWYQGYNVPASTYLSSSGNTFTLNVPFGVPFPTAVTDKITVKVILPETSVVSSVVVPPALKQGDDQVRFTYLDTSGRTVLTFTGNNIVAQNNGNIKVTYTVAPAAIVREPLMLVSAFFAVFVAYMLLSRVNLTL